MRLNRKKPGWNLGLFEIKGSAAPDLVGPENVLPLPDKSEDTTSSPQSRGRHPDGELHMKSQIILAAGAGAIISLVIEII